MSDNGASSYIYVNGRRHSLADPDLTVVMRDLGIDSARRGLAVALNEQLLPRREWAGCRLVPGDRLEIVQPLSGGAGENQ